jgi:hypothetical protein
MELKDIEGLTDEQIASITKIVQSETDKVRTDYSGRLKAANDEIAKFKPAEKSEQERALEERIKKIEEKEQQLNAKEKQNTIAEKLKEKGLPVELSSFISIGDDIDSDVEKVATTLGKYFLNSNYKPEGHANSKGITKEQFAKMSYIERAKLYEENPELYKMLSK